jgi:NAD(P)H-dependent flavin oxidoreductase YrpB (nitropropane dioxygenase family)
MDQRAAHYRDRRRSGRTIEQEDNMWPSNPLTERLKLKHPIILAPMGLITTPALAAAVSNAGGLGGIGMWGLTAEEAARRIAFAS